MNNYAETLRQHRRLAILRHLDEVTDYTSNSSILQGVLQGLGLPSSSDQVVTELAWLKEQGFVELSGQADFMVVTATRRGTEIARGMATHPDIQRPRPRA